MPVCVYLYVCVFCMDKLSLLFLSVYDIHFNACRNTIYKIFTFLFHSLKICISHFLVVLSIKAIFSQVEMEHTYPILINNKSSL